jgi:putative N6-adenine-specific DNA methylase
MSKRSRPASKPAASQPPHGQKAGARPAPSALALLECFAIVAPGLEPLALAEARAAGLPAELAEGGGGIAWRGDLRSVLLANAGLRIVSRVVVRLAGFEARSFAELERHARQIPWASVVAPGSAVRFRVTCKKSKLYHSDAVAQRLADAVTRALPGVRAEGSSESDDEGLGVGENAQLFVVRVLRDWCTVSADTSGALLHRRGYRQATAKAPLRETLAAALIAASAWDVASPLVDPFCGSGTIPIEAALMARGRAPGALRTFAAERWPGVSRTLGERVRAELAARAATTPMPPIRGYDRDAGAIEAAVSNAERARVGAHAEFAVRPLSAAEFPTGDRGWVVTNPPYGVRVGDAERVRDLWAQLGHVLRQRAPGWRFALLSPDAALERQLGLPTRVVAQTSNGGIPVRLVIGEVGG